MLNVTYPIVICPCLQQGSTTAGIGNTSSSSNGEDGGGNIGFDLINALLGFDNAESRMTELVTQINYFLTGKGKSTVCDMGKNVYVGKWCINLLVSYLCSCIEFFDSH